jgi:hypothetical protein
MTYYATETGLNAVEKASRGPFNKAGYLAYLDTEAPLDPVMRSNVEEALNTYRTCCYKATAVMMGAAVENLVMNLRDALQRRPGANPAKDPKRFCLKKAL